MLVLAAPKYVLLTILAVEALPFPETPVIVRRVLAHFGLRQSLQPSNSAGHGAKQSFPAWAEPRAADASQMGQATLEYKINAI